MLNVEEVDLADRLVVAVGAGIHDPVALPASE